MSVRLSCALPPSTAIAEQARQAERLGYHRVWVFDSPALHGDLWIALAQVAAATERIRLGTGVAVAGLRHPMVTAAAAAAVAELAPGRLTLGFGTGYTARRALGQPPVRVGDLVDEVLGVGWTGTPNQLRDKVAQAAAGVTEIVYVPAGPDVTGELAAYAEALSAL